MYLWLYKSAAITVIECVLWMTFEFCDTETYSIQVDSIENIIRVNQINWTYSVYFFCLLSSLPTPNTYIHNHMHAHSIFFRWVFIHSMARTFLFPIEPIPQVYVSFMGWLSMHKSYLKLMDDSKSMVQTWWNSECWCESCHTE